jgi:myo-inositol-1(or 4)-monophosphatase
MEEVLQQVLKVARLASTFISNNFGKVGKFQIEEKALNSLVSFVDKGAEKIIVNGLKTIIPSAGFLTEENTINTSKEIYQWIIDPLDGTTNFLMGVPHFAVSIALYKDDKPLLGVIVEVNSKDEYYACLGGGAYLNGTRISVLSSQTKINDVLIATGFPYSNEYDIDLKLNTVKAILLNTRGIRRFGSAALDLAYVASGRYGAYYESMLNPWDIAAGALIVEEAGGQVTDFKGQNNYHDGREIIASPPHFNTQMINLMNNESFD